MNILFSTKFYPVEFAFIGDLASISYFVAICQVSFLILLLASVFLLQKKFSSFFLSHFGMLVLIHAYF